MIDYTTKTNENKRCFKCGRELPANLKYFSRRDNGLRGSCKECEKEAKKEYYQKNKVELINKSRKQSVNERKNRQLKRKQREAEVTSVGNWKEIKGYEKYLISDEGKIFSKKTGKLMKPSVREDGYVVTGLWDNNKVKNVYIHRLVIEAFSPENKKETVNHIDGVKTNNHISNLEWNTYAENNRHAIETGLNTSDNKRNNKNSIPVLQYGLDGNLIKEYPSMRQAERETGIDATSIGHGIRKGWKYGGFIWKFK